MSTDFTLNRDQAILLAMELCGAKDVEQTITSSQLQQGVRMLQAMLKAWVADGLHLWTQTNGVVFPVVGKQKYLLGASGDRSALLSDTVFTSVDGDQTASTSLDVADATGIAVSDNIGVAVSGALEWFTVSAISSNTITLSGTPSAAVVDGDPVYAYTTLLERPLRVLSARRRVDDVDVPLEHSTRREYERLTTKSNKGAAVQYYYSPQLTQGELYIWPTAEDAKQSIILTFERTIKDVDNNDDDFDLPQEWIEAIAYNLSVRLANVYQTPAQTYQILKGEAEQKKAEILAWDQELPSIQLTPDWRY